MLHCVSIQPKSWIHDKISLSARFFRRQNMKFLSLIISGVSLILLLSSGCSSLDHFPLIPLDVKITDDRNVQITVDNDSIQRFEIEGFTVIFDKNELRITIIPQNSSN